MRRADRLFQIVQHLRARRLTTAAQLGEWLSVSPRTIYRDIQDLSLSGVPVEGEAGLGYRLSRSFDVQPIMFSTEEVEALVAGLRMVAAWGGPSLRSASRSALSKVTLALPKERRAAVEDTKLFAPSFQVNPETGLTLETLRQAIQERRRLSFSYTDRAEQKTQRSVRPLGLFFWGSAWTLGAWCEMRGDFRNFRLDRISDPSAGDPFPLEAGQTLEDFLAAVRAPAQSGSAGGESGCDVYDSGLA